MLAQRIAICGLAFSSFGCGSEEESAGTTMECVTERRVTTPEDATLGFSASSAVGVLDSPLSGRLRWKDGALTDVALTAGALGEGVALIAATQGTGAINCVSYLEVPATIVLSTDDGLLDETLEIKWRVSSAESLLAQFEIDPASLRGAFDASKLQGKLTLGLIIEDGQMHGSLSDIVADSSAAGGASVKRELVAEW